MEQKRDPIGTLDAGCQGSVFLLLSDLGILDYNEPKLSGGADMRKGP